MDHGPYQLFERVQGRALRADQHTEAGGVQELDGLHVDDQVVLPRAHQVDQLLAQLGRRVDVDLATHHDDRAVPFCAVVKGQVNCSSSIGLLHGSAAAFRPRAARTPAIVI